MKDIRVGYEVSATFNLGDFENVKPSIAISATVDKEAGETPDSVLAKIKAFADAQIQAEAADIRKNK